MSDFSMVMTQLPGGAFRTGSASPRPGAATLDGPASRPTAMPARVSDRLDLSQPSVVAPAAGNAGALGRSEIWQGFATFATNLVQALVRFIKSLFDAPPVAAPVVPVVPTPPVAAPAVPVAPAPPVAAPAVPVAPVPPVAAPAVPVAPAPPVAAPAVPVVPAPPVAAPAVPVAPAPPVAAPATGASKYTEAYVKKIADLNGLLATKENVEAFEQEQRTYKANCGLTPSELSATQTILKDRGGYTAITVNGQWDQPTAIAVLDFKQKNGLHQSYKLADGTYALNSYLDQATFRKIGELGRP